MLTSDVLHGLARRQRRRIPSLHHLACTHVPVRPAFYGRRGGSPLHAHDKLPHARLWQCCFCVPCPAGQTNDAFMHKSNEPHEAEHLVTSAGRCALDLGKRIASSAYQPMCRFAEQLVALKHTQTKSRSNGCVVCDMCSLAVVFDRRRHNLHWVAHATAHREETAVQQWYTASCLDPLQWDNSRCCIRRHGLCYSEKRFDLPLHV
jgi:hypothetical protein